MPIVLDHAGVGVGAERRNAGPGRRSPNHHLDNIPTEQVRSDLFQDPDMRFTQVGIDADMVLILWISGGRRRGCPLAAVCIMSLEPAMAKSLTQDTPPVRRSTL